VLDRLREQVVAWRSGLEARRRDERVRRLRALGMHIGERVIIPTSTWIDESHCLLISIGDDCGFGQNCVILAHDAQMNEFLDATRLGRVVIHPSCHIGAGTLILPGVEIGPRTVVGAGSVVSRALPPQTVCAGSPARVVCSLDEYLGRHRSGLEQRPRFAYEEYRDITRLTPEQRQAFQRAAASGDIYIIGPVCAATLAADTATSGQPA
jgi:maltose O-acetyltransferase